MGPRNHVLDGGQHPQWEGPILRGKGLHIVKYRDTQLCKNDWTDRFSVWVVESGEPEGSTSPIVFARLRQCALMGGHIGATWQIWLDRPSAAAMRPYVKLLWPSASEHPLDVAYCYSRCSMVCQFVIVSICHNYDSCKSSWTDHDAVRDVDSGGLNEPCIRWGSRSPMRRGNFEGQRGLFVKLVWPLVNISGLSDQF